MVIHAAAAAAAHAAAHAKPPPSIFVKIMNVTVGGAAAFGVGAGIAGVAYRHAQYVPVKAAVKEGEGEEEEAAEPAAEGEEGGDQDRVTPSTTADAEEGRIERDGDLQHMKWVLRSAMVGGLVFVLATPCILVLSPNTITWQGACHIIKWSTAWRDAATASAFLIPFPIAYFAVGEQTVVENIPKCLFAVVMTNTLVSLAIFPLEFFHLAGGLRKHQTTILYYLTGMRVGVMGAGAMLVFCFASRYARVQARKVLTKSGIEFRDLFLHRLNLGVIVGGWAMGMATSGVWVWIAYTDWAGASPDPTLFMIPLAYVVSITMHLKAPSTDHDEDDSMSMMREGFMGMNSVVLVPNPIQPMVVGLQRLMHFAFMACWYGTLNNEFQLCHTAESLMRARMKRLREEEENPLAKAAGTVHSVVGPAGGDDDGETALSQDPTATAEAA